MDRAVDLNRGSCLRRFRHQILALVATAALVSAAPPMALAAEGNNISGTVGQEPCNVYTQADHAEGLTGHPLGCTDSLYSVEVEGKGSDLKASGTLQVTVYEGSTQVGIFSGKIKCLNVYGSPRRKGNVSGTIKKKDAQGVFAGQKAFLADFEDGAPAGESDSVALFTQDRPVFDCKNTSVSTSDFATRGDVVVN